MPVSLTNINIGSSPGDGTGDLARTAFGKINDNNDALEAAVLTQAEFDARVDLKTLGVRELWIPVRDMIYPTNSPPAAMTVIQGVTNVTKIALQVALFDASTVEALAFTWKAPQSIDVSEGFSARFYWVPTTTNTGVVYWRSSVEKLVDGSTFDAFHSQGIGTDGSMQDAGLGVANALQISPWSTWMTGLSFSKGDFLSFPMFRNADNVADTYTGDAGLAGVALRYKVDAAKDDE